MDSMVAQVVGRTSGLLVTEVGQFGIGCRARLLVDHLSNRAAVTEDVEIHGREGTAGSGRTHAESGQGRDQYVAVFDR